MNFFTRLGRVLLLSAVAALWLSGCGGDSGTDPGNTQGWSGGNNNCTSAAMCKSKEMPDGKIWMTENLNIQTANSWCYENSPDSCTKYGRLYTWDAAMMACPRDWHLPTNQEYNKLVTFVGDWMTAGNKLKSKSGWYNNVNGTDYFGFSALPGGIRSESGWFGNAGSGGYWWTATEDNSVSARELSISWSGSSATIGALGNSNAISVRCIAD